MRLVVFVACFALCVAATSVYGQEITNSAGMTLRLLDAGRFERGERDLAPGFYKDHVDFNTAEDDRPVHPVVLTRPYYLSSTEVTVAQFRAFVEATGYVTSAERQSRGAVGWDPKSPEHNPRYLATFRDNGNFNWKHPGFEQTDEHPVVCVSYADAQAYCQWLSDREQVKYRLPTEAEWEYAARAGTTSYFYFGDVYRHAIHQHANIGNVELEQAFPDRVRRQWLVDVERDPADAHVFTAPVGSYRANPWGLFDLYGNVWEWCEDYYLDTAYATFARDGYQRIRRRAIDPVNTQRWNDSGEWRVIRGGAWFNAPIQCRSGVRGYYEAQDAACYLGFRVARDAPPPLIDAAQQKFAASEAARSSIEALIGREQMQERRDGRLTLLLRQAALSEAFFAALKQLSEPLDLHINGEGRLTPAQLAQLLQAPYVSALVLSQTGEHISDQDLHGLSAHPHLELLQITGASQLTDTLFDHLRNHDRLQLLNLEGRGITDEGLQSLPALAHLKALQLHGTSCEGLALPHFRNSPLQVFHCDKLTDEGALGLVHYPQLRDVNLSGSPITGRSLAVLAGLGWTQHLVLNNCRSLRDEDFAVLGNLYELRGLHVLQTAAGDQGLEGIARLNHLHELAIGSEHLSNAGVRRICEIVSLRNLNISEEAVNVTDAGLLDLWRLVNVHSLSVSAPKITGTGLATLPELSSLTWLQLGSTALTDTALQHAARTDTLQRLIVGNWQQGGPSELTDAGIGHLAEARNLMQVELIRRQTQVSDAALEQLRQQKPQLRINVR